jgi:hypothetical protein
MFLGISLILPNLNGDIIRYNSIESTNRSMKSLDEMTTYENYTHTVFIGVATSQTCAPCHTWNQNLHSAYESGIHDFEYAEMIRYDNDGQILNYKADEWASGYVIGSYPTSIFDRDYQRIVGDHPEDLADALDICGNREVANISANMTLNWMGNATFEVNISIQNNEGNQYDGHILAFITEIISRYNTDGGDPYNFGFLDFAFDKNISISSGGEYTDSIVWNGNDHEDAHGDNFGDIAKGNIQVTMIVYKNDEYLDETVKARMTANSPPYSPNNPSPTNHATDVSINATLYWSGGDPDPGDTVTYDVYFGTTNNPPQVVTGQSATTYDPGTMNFSTKYYWKIVSWDNHGGNTTGPIWDFTTGSASNDPPNPPSNPSPEDGETDVSIDTLLGWTCSDPNGDSLVYDVFLEAEDPTPDELVSDDQITTTYDPEYLEYGTLYYWQIIAKDNHSSTTSGPIWSFTIIPPPELEVTITRPINGSFYLRNMRIFPLPRITIVYGPIDISVNATSSIGIRSIELYINEKLVETFTEESFSYRWKPIICSRYKIKVIAYDENGGQAEDEIIVFKWRAHPLLILATILLLLKYSTMNSNSYG